MIAQLQFETVFSGPSREPPRSGDDRRQFHEEKSWRCLADTENDGASDADILVSRWTKPSVACRHEKTVPSSSRHVIGVALKATRVKLARGSSTVFDGSMPAGTLHVTGPGQPLTAEFRGPCDFVHFHVSSDYLRECQEAARSSQAQPIRDLNDLIVRDPLAEVALAVGFHAQAHFTTVFKRLTDQTPARWKSSRVRDASRQSSGAL